MNKKHRWRNEGFNGIACLFIRLSSPGKLSPPCLWIWDLIQRLLRAASYSQARLPATKVKKKIKIITITCRWLLARLTVDRVL